MFLDLSILHRQYKMSYWPKWDKCFKMAFKTSISFEKIANLEDKSKFNWLYFSSSRNIRSNDRGKQTPYYFMDIKYLSWKEQVNKLIKNTFQPDVCKYQKHFHLHKWRKVIIQSNRNLYRIPNSNRTSEWMLTKPPPMTATFFLWHSEESMTAELFVAVAVAVLRGWLPHTQVSPSLYSAQSPAHLWSRSRVWSGPISFDSI